MCVKKLHPPSRLKSDLSKGRLATRTIWNLAFVISNDADEAKGKEVSDRKQLS